MGAVSLWSLVPVRQCLGMVARPGVCGLQPVVGARVRVILWLGRRLWLWGGLWRMGRLRLASDWALRLFPSVVGWIRLPLRLRRFPWRLQPLRGHLTVA